MSYGDLPKGHYRRVAQLRDSVAVCLVLDPTVVDGHHVSQITVTECSGHVLGDLLSICRVYRSDPTKAIIETIETHELVRLIQLADAGLAWRWYSEFYARILNHLHRLERTYFTLASDRSFDWG
jgi:hypothetical protein